MPAGVGRNHWVALPVGGVCACEVCVCRASYRIPLYVTRVPSWYVWPGAQTGSFSACSWVVVSSAFFRPQAPAKKMAATATTIVAKPNLRLTLSAPGLTQLRSMDDLLASRAIAKGETA